MKINDIEKMLGLTKANIRFYEKQGLITPQRTENGYRDYRDEDIVRLKEIIILRKLGIPVQQIADILDGALPLQEALYNTIQSLQAEIEKLNGSLVLCKQMKQENIQILDAERYWYIIQEKETRGMKFQSLVYDYTDFLKPVLQGFFWYIPEGEWFSLGNILKCALIFSVMSGVLGMISGSSFFAVFFRDILSTILTVLLWVILLIVPYIVSRKDSKKGKHFRDIVFIVAILLLIILSIAILTYGFISAV